MHTEVIYPYENRRDVTLTSYVLDDSPELLGGRKRPAVLVCPGGAYLNCSDREAEPVALRFNAMGYHAFVLRYSVYSHHAPGFFPAGIDLLPDESCQYPAPMRDIGQAFLTIGARAEEWLLDTARIAICGFSAGAHNCAMYSVYWNRPVIRDFFNAPAEALRPAACILAYPICDYHLMMGEPADAFAAGLATASSVAYLGSAEPDDALLDEVSPSRQVNADTPPMFLWATAGDTLVPVENSTRMATALAAAGVPFEIHVFEEGPHGLSLADQATAGSLFEMNADAANWVPLVESWLKKRLALPIREKPFWQEMLEKEGRA